jgi:hypothetical protein
VNAVQATWAEPRARSISVNSGLSENLSEKMFLRKRYRLKRHSFALYLDSYKRLSQSTESMPEVVAPEEFMPG